MNSVLYGNYTTLVILTITTQAAVGISFFRPFQLMIEPGHVSTSGLFVLILLTLAGALVSVFHLGHPARMFTALQNPLRSWLSREVICLALFLAAACSHLVFGVSSTMPSILLAFSGLLLLITQAMVYVVPGYSAMATGAPLLLFLFSSLTLGISLIGCFGDEVWRQSLVQSARFIFSGGLLVAILMPWGWRLGNTIISETAKAWFRSPHYYLWVIFGYILPLLALIVSDQIPVWLPLMVMGAECLGRILFFKETRHASGYIGTL
jgi:DMSO reductase anchor subunit